MQTLLATLALATGLFAMLAGCNSASSSPSNLPVTKMKIGRQTFTLEIANTDPSRTRGLMYRESMPSSHGMIFVFPRADVLSFWMKNTKIPLDIIYLASDGRVVSIHPMRPYVLDGISSGDSAQYAIELNQGAAASASVKVGDVLIIPPEARLAKD